MSVYTVQTDGFLCDEIEAENINEAIEYAFSGEGLGKIVDVHSLQRKFAKYVLDGGYCKIECDGEEVLVIGTPF